MAAWPNGAAGKGADDKGAPTLLPRAGTRRPGVPDRTQRARRRAAETDRFHWVFYRTPGVGRPCRRPRRASMAMSMVGIRVVRMGMRQLRMPMPVRMLRVGRHWKRVRVLIVLIVLVLVLVLHCLMANRKFKRPVRTMPIRVTGLMVSPNVPPAGLARQIRLRRSGRSVTTVPSPLKRRRPASRNPPFLAPDLDPARTRRSPPRHRPAESPLTCEFKAGWLAPAAPVPQAAARPGIAQAPCAPSAKESSR